MTTITMKLTDSEIALLDELVRHNRFKSRSDCLRHSLLVVALAGPLREEKFMEVLASRKKVQSRVSTRSYAPNPSPSQKERQKELDALADEN